MRKIFIILVLSLVSYGYAKSEKKTVCLNMIVKDESAVIERCLHSVMPFIDTWVIVDTGSTDGTQKVIKNCLKKIPGQLYERPWVNFEHNRNEALNLARNKADYILIMDADDFLRYDKGFTLPSLDKQMYFFTFDYNGTTYQRPQLIQSGLPWKWVGVLHEYLDYGFTTSRGILEGITYVEIKEGNRSNDPEKYLKDARIFEIALEKEPSNSRYVFYLAQSYRDAGQKEQSLENYLKRSLMGGWDEEIFYSLYSVGKLKYELKKPYEEVVDAFTKAFTNRPTRAEPLYHLALFFRNHNNFLLGYLTAARGLEIKQPQDMFLVESWIYDWGLLMEKSVCAYWLGNYQECLATSLNILRLKNLPSHVRDCVEKNMDFAIAKIQENRTYCSL